MTEAGGTTRGRLHPRHLAGVPGRRARRTWRRAVERWRNGTPPERQWVRTVMLADIRSHLDGLPTAELEVAECSSTTYDDRAWKGYTVLRYPEFDLTDPPTGHPTFDVVVCEQVLEHVADPWAAARTLAALCRPGGHVIVSTPFLVRVHKAPTDFWRFTPDGLEALLTGAGLEVDRVRSWGNRSAVWTSTYAWAPQRRWRSLRNVDDLPVVVWAFARRPTSTTGAGPAGVSARRAGGPPPG